MTHIPNGAHLRNGIPMREICSELDIPFDDHFCPQVFWDFSENMFFVYVCGRLAGKFSLEDAESAGHSFEALLNVLRGIGDTANGIRSAFRVLTWPLWFDAEIALWPEDRYNPTAVEFLERRIKVLNHELTITHPRNEQHREWLTRRRDTLRSELETFLKPEGEENEKARFR